MSTGISGDPGGTAPGGRSGGQSPPESDVILVLEDKFLRCPGACSGSRADRSDRTAAYIRSAVKSNFTDWCCQNLSKRDLNALTVQASTTELGCSKHLQRVQKKMLSLVIMKRMILQFILVASGVSSFVERKIRLYCCIVYIMGNFKNFNHITSQASVF